MMIMTGVKTMHAKTKVDNNNDNYGKIDSNCKLHTMQLVNVLD